MKGLYGFSAFIMLFFVYNVTFVKAQGDILTPEPTIYFFGSDDCEFCKIEFKYIFDEGFKYEYQNISKDAHARDLYQQIIDKHNIGNIIPVAVIGEVALVGFNNKNTTGEAIKQAVEKAKYSDVRTVQDHLARAPKTAVVAGRGCKGLECETNNQQFIFKLPFLGVVDLQKFSLLSLSVILGFIEGFSLYVLWVFAIFLMLLSKISSNKKIIIFTSALLVTMTSVHNILLQSWYFTWDFTTLFQSELTQAYLKIIELNRLSILARQGYFLVHTVSYIIAIGLAFALATWGCLKLREYDGTLTQKSPYLGGAIVFILGTLFILITKL